jgi:hypothetical protein
VAGAGAVLDSVHPRRTDTENSHCCIRESILLAADNDLTRQSNISSKGGVMKRKYFFGLLLFFCFCSAAHGQATPDPQKLTPLFGTWKFYYVTTGFSVSTYTLDRMVKDATGYYAYGASDSGKLAIATFDVAQNTYGLREMADDMDKLYLFNIYGPFAFGVYMPETKSGEPLGTYNFFGIRIKK